MKTLFIPLFLIFTLLVNAQNNNLSLRDWPQEANPEQVGLLVANRFIASPHNSFYPPEPARHLTYPETCAWYGALRFAQVTQNKELLRRLEERLILLCEEEKHLFPTPTHVDNNVFGIVPIETYLQTGNISYLNLGMEYADLQWTMPDNPAPDRKERYEKLMSQNLTWQTRYWIDDMFMITMIQSAAYRALNGRKYIDRAAYEMGVYLDTLQQDNGLFYHAPDAPFYWARGNGWMAAGMAELLSVLPEHNKNRPQVVQAYLKMMKTLKEYQRADGLWGQLLDDPDSWVETSGSAMFAYAFIQGVKNGWLDKEEYTPAARKAWIALMAYINKDGDISNVCEGTNRKNDRQYYLDRKQKTGDMHGQAPLLWCAAALLEIDPKPEEDGGLLWLRSSTDANATVTTNKKSPTIDIAVKELKTQWKGVPVRLVLTKSKELDKLGEEGYRIEGNQKGVTVESTGEKGLLYAAYHLLRLQETGKAYGKISVEESPAYDVRVLNHWDNLDRTIERGYAGHSLWMWEELPGKISPRYEAYARANASIGINGTVLNNVNSTANILKTDYLNKINVLADIFRPYGIKVYVSVKFSTPKELGGTTDSDPMNPEVQKWWKNKAKEIYQLIPDFGGFLVKANSEGQPGPQDYGRTHADGANMLADALKPYGGIVMWRAFVYEDVGIDRTIQAYKEFMPLDGQFNDNVIVQVKNGPIDFQPRETFTPLFGAMQKTPVMPELQITQEYLGHSNHLVFLALMWEEFLNTDTYCKGEGSTVAAATDRTLFNHKLTGIAGVANIGEDANWTGHHFGQANWYSFGRLAWDNKLTSAQIADEWLRMTFTPNPEFVQPVKQLMLDSYEALVSYMTPLGLNNLFTGERHHYNPGPWADTAKRQDYTRTYYHKASTYGIGFNRTTTGSNAVSQYFSPLKEIYNNPATCPDKYLLWFHHLPWDFRMKSNKTLWDELCYYYDWGVKKTREFQQTWDRMERYVDKQRFTEVQYKLKIQARDAIWWRDACLLYFQKYSKRPIPYELERPLNDLEELKEIKLDMKHHN